MLDLNDIHYFVRVIEHESFSEAARALGIPRSRLSRRIAALERRLGVQLIYRSTRRLSLSELGTVFHRHCVAMMDQAVAAEEAIDQALAAPRGLIRLSCPMGILHFRMATVLSDFMTCYPQVRVELLATDRRVDIVDEGIDVALRVRSLPLEDSDLNMRFIARSERRLLMAPALLERYGKVDLPEQLDHFPALGGRGNDGRCVWHLYGPAEAYSEVEYMPRLCTDDLVTLRHAALAGLGVAQLPVLVAGEDLRHGRLIEVLPGWKPADASLHAVFSARRGRLPALQALLDFLVERLGGHVLELDMAP
ncbi:LysR substrate-binding domain-containing protein [Kushneria marisflavi]|uniref:LysR family transcriptional regulator n=1 Tax=Kushneria marisflavi TaxID=157779 RepID=A0A240UQY6_9GAMM|nr:LysR substrate-binding domain-containing protein [Kushneria marisflavi]ART63901.1 LysR family transcriptional regulator [Kushneria marisflavi]RKD85617.1 DNA-binding transcriptional LysR family regulator [Kushneria marisflavi]